MFYIPRFYKHFIDCSIETNVHSTENSTEVYRHSIDYFWKGLLQVIHILLLRHPRLCNHVLQMSLSDSVLRCIVVVDVWYQADKAFQIVTGMEDTTELRGERIYRSPSLFCMDMYSWLKSATLFSSALNFLEPFDLTLSFIENRGSEFLLIVSCIEQL